MQVFDHGVDTCFMVVVTQTYCAARLWTISILFLYVCVQGSHMAAAYSNWGLTKVK